MSDDKIGLIVILGIIAIIIFGGFKNSPQSSFNSTRTPSPASVNQKASLEKQLEDAKRELETLQKEEKEKEEAKTRSPYKGMVKINFVNRSGVAQSEYLVLNVNSTATTTVNITGWTLKSLSTGTSVTIPKGTYLIFANSLNSEDDVILTARDTAYIITGTSPNGYSFKVNKCSGYMSQFQTYNPYLSTQCPAPRDEDLSSIPNRVINDVCFDYIESFPACRIQTDPLPLSFSSECRKFITEKINYKTCVDIHKGDSDFYLNDWRIYLKRSDALWKTRKESIVLLDMNSKIVDTLTY